MLQFYITGVAACHRSRKSAISAATFSYILFTSQLLYRNYSLSVWCEQRVLDIPRRSDCRSVWREEKTMIKRS